MTDHSGPDQSGGFDLSAAFDHASRRYDLMVGLNPGYHDHLRAAAAELARRIGPGPVVDLGCGSGASTDALMRAGLDQIIGVDASPGMLDLARAKSWPSSVSFEVGRAEHLPRILAERPPASGVFAAYLFRNVPDMDRDAALTGIRDVLTPGGWLVAQDYSIAGRRADAVWSAVCWGVVIPMSAVLLRDTSLYRYLWRSGRGFDAPMRFMQRLSDAGFTDIAVRSSGGWQRGILHTFVARAPEVMR